MYFCVTDCAAVHDGPEDSDEGCTGGQPIGQPAEGGRGHPCKAEEGEWPQIPPVWRPQVNRTSHLLYVHNNPAIGSTDFLRVHLFTCPLIPRDWMFLLLKNKPPEHIPAKHHTKKIQILRSCSSLSGSFCDEAVAGDYRYTGQKKKYSNGTLFLLEMKTGYHILTVLKLKRSRNNWLCAEVNISVPQFFPR